MSSGAENPSIRERLAALRHELCEVSAAYHQARARGRSEAATKLLRQRSALIECVLNTQRELLVLLRDEPKPAPGASSNSGVTEMEIAAVVE